MTDTPAVQPDAPPPAEVDEPEVVEPEAATAGEPTEPEAAEAQPDDAGEGAEAAEDEAVPAAAPKEPPTTEEEGCAEALAPAVAEEDVPDGPETYGADIDEGTEDEPEPCGVPDEGAAEGSEAATDDEDEGAGDDGQPIEDEDEPEPDAGEDAEDEPESWVCGQCGADLPDRFIDYCSKCGTPVTSRMEDEPEQDICGEPECGAAINAGDKFCCICGSGIIWGDEEVPTEGVIEFEKPPDLQVPAGMRLQNIVVHYDVEGSLYSLQPTFVSSRDDD